MSRPRLSMIVLTATASLICSILFVWLLVAPWIKIKTPKEPVWAIALDPPDGIVPSVSFAQRDARLTKQSRETTTSMVEPAQSLLMRELGGFLDDHRGRPVLISLVGWCQYEKKTPDGGEIWLVTSSALSGDPAGRVSLKDVLAILNERGKESNKLLVLDLSQNGPDRSLGVAPVDLADYLRAEIGKNSHLAVLLSASTGQLSWVSESSGTSVFAHYLREALDGRLGGFGRVSASDLHRYIAPRVADWVRTHRGGGVQTPLLIGDHSLRVALPGRSAANSRQPALEPIGGAMLSTLIEEWSRSEALARRTIAPSRSHPIAWRRYRNELLKAERLMRSRSSQAPASLSLAAKIRQEIETTNASPLIARPWSVAVANTLASASSSVDAKAFHANMGRLLADLESSIRKAGDPVAEKKPDGDDLGKKDEEPTVKQPPTPVVRPADLAYAEAQLPVWYLDFVQRGGELKALQSRRLNLVRRGFAIREQIEAVASDDRLLRWLRGLEEIDKERRQAQDMTFASDDGGLASAEDLINRLEIQVRQFAARMTMLSETMDLLDRLHADLPFYADFVGRTRLPLEDEYREILQDTTRAFEAVRSPAKDAATERDRETELLEVARRLLARETSFREQIARSLERITTSSDWVEVDALLSLPTLEPARRRRLLEMVDDVELSPSLSKEDVTIGEVEPKPDPMELRRAMILARADLALLRMTGLDTSLVEARVSQMEANFQKDPESASERLGRLSLELQTMKSAILPVSVGSNSETASQPTRRALELASSLAPLDLLSRMETQARDADDPERQRFVAWHASRLDDDFASQQAASLFTEVRQRTQSATLASDLTKRLERAVARSSARLAVTVGDTGEILLQREAELPEGLAVAFVPDSPDGASSHVGVTVKGENSLASPSLIAVPRPDPAILAFSDASGRPTSARRPFIYYRGHIFAPESSDNSVPKELAEVRMRQLRLETLIESRDSRNKVVSSRKVKVPDQFVRNRDRGFVHPGGRLDYKLEIKNTSNRPIKVFVSHGLDGLKPRIGELSLNPGETNQEVVGSVSASDLVENEDRNVVVRVTENLVEGATVAKPLAIPFRKIKPSKDYIKQTVSYFNGRLTISVTHLEDDPVTSPIHIDLRPQPLEAFVQKDLSPFEIPLGETMSYVFQITNRSIPSLTWSLFADGEEILKDKVDVAPPEPPIKPETAPVVPPAGARPGY